MNNEKLWYRFAMIGIFGAVCTGGLFVGTHVLGCPRAGTLGGCGHPPLRTHPVGDDAHIVPLQAFRSFDCIAFARNCKGTATGCGLLLLHYFCSAKGKAFFGG